MCGIAGLIYKSETADIGRDMTTVLQNLKHRGPDSTGFGLYGPRSEDEIIMRVKVAEQDDLNKGFEARNAITRRRDEVERRIDSLGGVVLDAEEPTEYAFRYRLTYDGEIRRLVDYIEEIDQVEVQSLGRGLELIKDLGDAARVSSQYNLQGFKGTHAIGHVRMATESDVDIRSAHPFWAYPFYDVSVVHNGQLTNYWAMRRSLERDGMRFQSDCDSELIGVYLANRMNTGLSFEEALRQSVDEFDGVFSYLVATSDALGMVKDVMAAKPMVLYESDDLIALASEEGAIQSIVPHEIDTRDPYEGEVLVWQT